MFLVLKTNIILHSDKGRGLKAHLFLSEVRTLLRGGSSLGRPVILLGSICPAPRLGPPTVRGSIVEADLSWWLPQGQVPRHCPGDITQGARHPGPSWASGSSAHPNEGRSPGLWPMERATTIRAWRGGSGRGLLLLQGLNLTVPGPQITHWPEAGGPWGEGHDQPALHPLPRDPFKAN